MNDSAAATQEWAQMATEWYSYEVGADSEQVSEMRGVALRPESHSGWNTRWPLTVGGLDMLQVDII
jgi:hypothetical protein